MRKCSKRRYRDRIAAELALATIERRDDGKHLERRVYFCGDCAAHHLTSRTRAQVAASAVSAEVHRQRQQ